MFHLNSLLSEAPPVIAADLNAYYDAFAEHHHLLFRDWRATVQRESAALRRLLRNRGVKNVLDASGKAGLHATALALQHLEVTAICPTQPMLLCARENAAAFNVQDDITFVRADLPTLTDAITGTFDAALLKGDTLTNFITDEALYTVLGNLHSLLRPEGTLVMSIPDFDLLLEDRPRFVPRHMHDDQPDGRAILFDVYDWQNTDPLTVLHSTFVVSGKGDSYTAKRFGVLQRALRRAELEALLGAAGFTEICAECGGWELHITARRP
jgi:SAM-dependent methyltransferase